MAINEKQMKIVMAVTPNGMETSETLNGLMVGSKFCWICIFDIGRFPPQPLFGQISYNPKLRKAGSPNIILGRPPHLMAVHGVELCDFYQDYRRKAPQRQREHLICPANTAPASQREKYSDSAARMGEVGATPRLGTCFFSVFMGLFFVAIVRY